MCRVASAARRERAARALVMQQQRILQEQVVMPQMPVYVAPATPARQRTQSESGHDVMVREWHT